MDKVKTRIDDEITLKAADNIRILSAAMVEKARSGHPGGAMGGADFINVLFSEFLVYDPDDPTWPFRDRFFLDPGHMSAMLYSVLALTGSYTIDDLKNFRQWGSITPGHPEVDIQHRVENTSGPLGQGHANAAGAAIAERFLADRFGEWLSHKSFAFISDGGIQEEISQGVGRIAGHLGLNNLIIFFDSNDLQLSTATDQVTSEDTAKKYAAWGWNTITIDGHDITEIRRALTEAQNEKKKPTLIIGKTIMGKGAVTDEGHSFEKQYSTHGQPLSKAGASFSKTIQNLNGHPDNPFKIFPEVEDYYDLVNDRKRAIVSEKKKLQRSWEENNPEQAKKLHQFLSGNIPDIDLSKIKHKANIATRVASSNVLSYLADHVDNMIVASADLSNSDKTNGFLDKTKSFSYQDFSGAFLQAGVSELTMAAIANGMALHGGIIPVCATFFVFSDFMKPAIRLAALMELPVIYIWTHDSFRVGEDGPTHQPIEQEAQIRLLEQLKNHSGNNSFLALRPADAAETTVAWEMALRNTKTPTGLILSRQNIDDIPSIKDMDRYSDAQNASKGAYIVQETEDEPDVILVGNGSEVATLIAGAELLEREKKLNVRVVSAISEGLFRKQPENYQAEIIPDNIPVLGLSSGLPVTLRNLVGPKGKCVGLDHFGHSAPAEVLDKQFGFTAENVLQEVEKYLFEYRL
ncbi:MAG TPA: transketolase [Balneolales bacterium]|nr:transketolase [Balneolales bacterium]